MNICDNFATRAHSSCLLVSSFVFPSALEKIIVTGFKTLQLQYFFTAGKDEVKAWTIQKGTKAPQAAGRIHTDFEKGFIMAEVELSWLPFLMLIYE